MKDSGEEFKMISIMIITITLTTTLTPLSTIKANNPAAKYLTSILIGVLSPLKDGIQSVFGLERSCTVSQLHFAVDAQGVVISFDTCEVSCGGAGAVWHLLVEVVRL